MVSRGASRRDGWAAATLVLAVVALHPRLVLGTAWRFGADALEYAVPHAALLFRELAAGRFPLWNPFHDGGAPFLAQPPWMGPFYPGVVVFALPAGRALDLGFLLHLSSFAAGAYGLARVRGIDPLASWLAGFAVGVGAPLASLADLGYLPEAVAASYLPWTLLCLDRGIRGVVSERVALAGAGVCLGLMHLGGHLVASGAVLFGAVFYALALGTSVGGHRGAGRALGLLIASEALGAVLAAVQLVPLVVSGLASSLRGGREISAEYAYLGEPWRAGQFLFARFDPSGKGHVFLGVALLPFVALAGRGARSGGRNHRELWAMAAGCGLLSLGDATPAWRLLRAAAPPLEIFSYFYFFLIPCALAVALLAAHGLDAWLAETAERAASARRLRVAALVLAALAVATAVAVPGDRYAETERLADGIRAGVPWALAALAVAVLVSVWPRASALAITAAVVAELVHFAAPLRPDRLGAFDVSGYFDRARLADALPPPGAGRVLGLERTRRAGDWVLRRNGGLVVPYEDVAIDSKLPLARVAALAARLSIVELDWVKRLAASKSAPAAAPGALTLTASSTDVRILDVLGVTSVVTDVTLEGGAYRRPLRDVTGDDAEHARVAVWERVPRPPRASLATSWRLASTPSEALARVLDEPVSPLESPVIETRGPLAAPPAGALPPGCPPVRRVWSAGEVSFDTTCDRATVLVTGEVAARGWRVTVDGQRASSAIANAVMLAVPLAGGDHHVEIRYVPTEVVAGAIVSAASGLGLALIVVARRRIGPAQR